jgi:glycosyltransferase involved in cell wall biosynthesis
MTRRILLLITDLEIGGTPTVVRELATRLNAPPDVEIEVACLSKWGPVADQLRAAGVNVTALGASGVMSLGIVPKLVRLIRSRKFDTVFSFLIHANAIAAVASVLCRDVRFLQSIQTVQRRPRWHWWLQHGIQHRAQVIVVPSAAVADAASVRCGVQTDRIVVVPNAIDPADFEIHPVFQKPMIRIGFLGRLDRVKLIGQLIAAVWWMSDLPVECHIFGEGPERRRLEQLITSYEVGNRVFFHGTVARPQEALRQMDVLVLPSPVEGFGLVLIEAMASGVPVIASRSGGSANVVQNQENGLLVGYDYYDREIQANVRRLAADAALRTNLIAGGLATVQEKFTWDVVLPQYRALLDLVPSPSGRRLG